VGKIRRDRHKEKPRDDTMIKRKPILNENADKLLLGYKTKKDEYCLFTLDAIMDSAMNGNGCPLTKSQWILKKN